MLVYYKSYLEFLIKADLLARDLALTAKEAAELLAKISGYEDYRTMPTGEETAHSPTPSANREDLMIRLLALRPDVAPKRACDIVTKLDLGASRNAMERPRKPTAPDTNTNA